jgi:hypothetical protein
VLELRIEREVNASPWIHSIVHVLFLKDPLHFTPPTIPRLVLSNASSSLCIEVPIRDCDEVENILERAVGKEPPPRNRTPIIWNIDAKFLGYDEVDTLEIRKGVYQCRKPAPHTRAILRGFAALDVDVGKASAGRWRPFFVKPPGAIC